MTQGPIRTATVFTHRRPRETNAVLRRLCALADQAGVDLRFTPEETRKHGLTPSSCRVVDAPVSLDVDLCLVLGGDGTILQGLRTYAGTGVPVFAVNFGEIGFLATIDRDEADGAMARAFSGDFDVLPLPGIELRPDQGWTAMNDVSIQRKPGMKVAQLAYSVGADVVGRVRCDGLVVSTPAGSTGYNLANGGPVMAWGVEGFVVSFIAPHSLAARALVVAPDDTVTIHNLSHEEAVDVTVDGRPACELAPDGSIDARFVHARGTLAQLPGANFYHRLRQKFGRLATEP